MKTVIALSAVAAMLPAIEAHGFVSGITVNGQWHGGWDPSYQYNPASAPAVPGWTTTVTDNGFVDPTTYTTPDIICHKGASAGKTFVTVAAGSKIDVTWNTWPDSHHGPVLNYLAACPGDCTKYTVGTKTDLRFVKIAADGLDTPNPQAWGSDKINQASNFTSSVTIPSNIKPGGYVLRHEIIALHSAGSANGAQNYPQCINLKITGSGTAAPTGTAGEALYKPTDAGILINIYTTLTAYTIPGPAIPAAFKAAKRFFA